MTDTIASSETSRGEAPRRRLGVRAGGVVQGVGFRPFVHRLATELALAGSVRNDARGVWIEIEGDEAALASFRRRLASDAPALARLDAIEVVELPLAHARSFQIVESAPSARGRAAIPCDVAPCDDCLRELADPADRRHRYPFVNCTACGPRYSIVRDVPYDRARTTMADFALCARCRAEYGDPTDRRFHAEPNACPACGPRLSLRAGPGLPVEAEGDAALRGAARAIAAGEIVAVKGLGGYLLATDARDEAAVARLRARKRRPHRPFAVMARDLDAIARVARLDEASIAALRSPARPIVLLPLRDDLEASSSASHAPHAPGLAPSVAPALREIGVMLPSTPLHALLLDEGPALQIMTSGNLAEEPIAKDDDDALARLSGIADRFLIHDRAIHTRVDDSVVRIVAGAPQPVRRARGMVPSAIALPISAPGGAPVLATGADLKNAVCLARDGEAFLSQHVGDLASPAAFAFFEETIDKLARLLDVDLAAATIAHDLHPEYRSTRWALARASGARLVPVQHHHAHVAACLAEHGRAGPAIGVAFDGTGCGPEGELWGGEILIADLVAFRRAGHLQPLALPGGEAAIRAPVRLALAALVAAEAPLAPLAALGARKLALLRALIERRVAAPRATGAGRWFDAVAALLGVRWEISYEGQAAIELEALAASGAHAPYDFAIDAREGAPFEIRLAPTIRAIVDELRSGAPRAVIAARFHETMSRAIEAACARVRAETGLVTVALSGGCFQNRLLTERALALLSAAGFEALVHRRVPPNDGGVALGQAAVASARASRATA
jgi:hydrogenase maturation protein HypF